MRPQSSWQASFVAGVLSAMVLAVQGALPDRSANADGVPSPAQVLEQVAHEKFGPILSSAELKIIRAAPLRDIAWVGPSDDPEDPSNDPSVRGNWGPERTIRAELLA